LAQTLRSACSFIPFLACLIVLSPSLQAQTEKTIAVRMLDGKTGILIATSSFLVRVNHQETEHADAQELSIHATYEHAMLTYVNCDADKDRGSSEHAAGVDRWYAVEKILSSGVVAPNNCAGKKIPDKLQVVASPGEFVFFVRPMNSMEKMRE